MSVFAQRLLRAGAVVFSQRGKPPPTPSLAIAELPGGFGLLGTTKGGGKSQGKVGTGRAWELVFCVEPILTLLCLPQRLDLSVENEESKFRGDEKGLARLVEQINGLLHALVSLPRLLELQMFPAATDNDDQSLSVEANTMEFLLRIAKRGRISVKVVKTSALYRSGIEEISTAILLDASAVDRLWD